VANIGGSKTGSAEPPSSLSSTPSKKHDSQNPSRKKDDIRKVRSNNKSYNTENQTQNNSNNNNKFVDENPFYSMDSWFDDVSVPQTQTQSKQINKYFMDKAQAELQFGFRLYQGGIVPGNQLRVVHIEDTDVEACCGTHCDNTSEVGWIKMLRTTRIADGTVRLYYVAGERTIKKLNSETGILNKLTDLWGVSYNEIVPTAERIFKDFKSLTNTTKKQEQQILNLQTRYVIDNPESQRVIFRSDEENPTIYFSYLGGAGQDLKERGKSLIYIGETFIYGVLGNPQVLNIDKLKEEVKRKNASANLKISNEIKHQNTATKKKVQVKDVVVFNYIGALDREAMIKFLSDYGFTVAEL